MNDDEQHLVVLVRQRTLRVQELVQIQVLRIAQRVAEIPVNLLVGQIDERLARRVRIRSCQVPKTQSGTVRQPGQQLPVQTAIIGFERLHQAPEGGRMIHVLRVRQLVHEQITHHFRREEHAASN